MATATLAVSVRARTANFERGMKRASAAVARMRAVLRSAARSALRFGAGLLTLGGIAGFGLVIKNAFKTTDALSKMAITLGANIGNLEALQFAARRFGTTTEDLNKSLVIFARRIGEVASTGAGEAKASFDNLGLSAEKLEKKLPFDALKDLAEALQKLPTQARRVDTAAELLGRSGTKLIPLLIGGAAGLDRMRRAFRMLGPTITEEGANKVTDANDAFEDFDTSVSILTRGISIGLGPVIKDLGNTLAGITSQVKGMNESISETVKEWAKWLGKIALAVAAFTIVGKAITVTVTAIKALITAVGSAEIFAGALKIASLVGGAFAAQFAVDEVDSISKKIEKSRIRGAAIQAESNAAFSSEALELARRTAESVASIDRKTFSGFAVVR